jgi:hypothetical protein
MGKISITKIHDAIIKGIENAQKKYNEWSGDDWLSWAPEYVLTCHIAEQISQIEGSKYVTLESGVKYTMSEAGALKKGRLSVKSRPFGKFDILVWKGNEEPRAIIEVKNSVITYHKIRKDIIRIQEVLSKSADSSTLQFGALAFYSEAKDSSRNHGRDILIKRMENFWYKAKEQVGESLDVSIKKAIHSEDEWHWGACCYLFKY